MANNLINITTLKVYLGIDGTSQDELLELLIKSVSAWVGNALGYDPTSQSYTEYYVAPNGSYLFLKAKPVTSISSIQIVNRSGDVIETLDSDDYIAYDDLLEQGMVQSAYGYWSGLYNTKGLSNHIYQKAPSIKITYTAGYTTLPSDLQLLVLQLIESVYNQQQQGAGGLKQLSQGGLTYIWDNNLNQRQQTFLNTYKRVSL